MSENPPRSAASSTGGKDIFHQEAYVENWNVPLKKTHGPFQTTRYHPDIQRPKYVSFNSTPQKTTYEPEHSIT